MIGSLVSAVYTHPHPCVCPLVGSGLQVNSFANGEDWNLWFIWSVLCQFCLRVIQQDQHRKKTNKTCVACMHLPKTTPCQSSFISHLTWNVRLLNLAAVFLVIFIKFYRSHVSNVLQSLWWRWGCYLLEKITKLWLAWRGYYKRSSGYFMLTVNIISNIFNLENQQLSSFIPFNNS